MGPFRNYVQALALNVAVAMMVLDAVCFNFSGSGDQDLSVNKEQFFSPQAGAVVPELPPDAGIEYCRSCHEDSIYPVDWEEASSTTWDMKLRCGNCQVTTTGTFSQVEAEGFDRVLERQTTQIISALNSLARENMECDVQLLTVALHGGHILPEDF